jgi:acyl-CoA thioesterase-1
MIKKIYIQLLSITIINILLFSCVKQTDIFQVNQDDSIQNSQKPDEQILDIVKYLALGDSYTIGQGVSEEERWPNQLSSKLIVNNYAVLYTDIVAQTGWTTNDLINAVNNYDLQEYNLVSLLIGVNNQYQNLDFDEFQIEFDSLLNMSINIAGNYKRLFVVSIPDYGVTPFGEPNSEQIAEEIDMYNNYICNTCSERNIPFINITEISRLLGSSDGALAYDNLHPSGSQYAAWVEEILPVVLEILENSNINSEVLYNNVDELSRVN